MSISNTNFRPNTNFMLYSRMNGTFNGIAVTVILAVPFLAAKGMSFGFMENMLIRLLAVGAVLYAIRLGPMAGILTMLAVISLFIERNHQLLTTLPNQKPMWPSDRNLTIIPVPPMFPTPETHAYHPTDDHGEVVEERHGEHVKVEEYESTNDLGDSNPRLDEVPQGEAAGSFYSQRGLTP
jgi:hypothetical protein